MIKSEERSKKIMAGKAKKRALQLKTLKKLEDEKYAKVGHLKGSAWDYPDEIL